MDTKLNGYTNGQSSLWPAQDTNGHASANEILIHGLDGEPSIEELEHELPVVGDGQFEMRELLSRLVQSLYAELTEMAETLPSMSDPARKRTIADWVVKTKKQVVKLYAVMKWARDADDVQKAMNITAFLMEQNHQFEEAVRGIIYAKESLAPARLRNHDLLTALDVLTTGSYLRLPTQIKKFFVQEPTLSDDEVAETLKDMGDQIRFRLRMKEIIPIEMSRYRIEDGRAHFNVPNMFETSISLRGAQKDDGWFFVHVEFLHNVGGDLIDVQDFPRRPTDALKQHITEEADSRLAYYLPLPPDPNPIPGFEPPPRPQLPPGTVDTPLVRLFNFLQMMSLTYQLEILFFQAQRLRALGWRDYLRLEKSRDGKSFTASYWIRPKPTSGNKAPSNMNRPKVPLIGGTLRISLVEKRCTPKAGGGPLRSPKDRLLASIQKDSKLNGSAPSDEVENFMFEVKWEPMKGALGVHLTPELERLEVGEFDVNPQDLNFEVLLRKAIMKHVQGILIAYRFSLENGPFRVMFETPGEVELVTEDGYAALKVHLCADEYITVSIDPRTGHITLRDTGGLAASGRGPRYALFSDRINDNPFLVYNILVGARFDTILELAEQKAQYLGLQTFRSRNLSREELAKFGPDIRTHLFIQLANFHRHYLVLLVTEQEFRFALISVQILQNSPTGSMIMEDIGWLDVQRIHSGGLITAADFAPFHPEGAPKAATGTFGLRLDGDQFRLDTEILRELYAYCCARVAYTKVELQLKLRSIPYTYLSASQASPLSETLTHLQSTLARSVPGLCVQSSDILAGAPAAEAAMPNIRVVPLNWWSSKKSQVVMCVKLKYVQQPVGKRAGTSTVIRPSKRIIYDTREAIVSFLSENVDTCVDEFLEEWAKVSKMVVIAREVAQMPKRKAWQDVQLLSFDLQTVEFAYAKDYAVAISCTDQLLPSSSNSYELCFSRISHRLGRSIAESGNQDIQMEDPDEDDGYNPHEEIEPFVRHVLRHGPQLSTSLRHLVELLRDSLPFVCVVDSIRRSAESGKDKNALAVGVDVFAKAAGWFRILYGDMRHALDFRLMTEHRVAILDASLSLTSRAIPGRSQTIPQSKTPKLASKSKSAASSSKAANQLEKSQGEIGKSAAPRGFGILQPIPDFTNLVREAVREALRSDVPATTSDQALNPSSSSQTPHATQTKRKHRVAQIDIGVVCDVEFIDRLAPRLHSRILSSLPSVSD